MEKCGTSYNAGEWWNGGILEYWNAGYLIIDTGGLILGLSIVGKIL